MNEHDLRERQREIAARLNELDNSNPGNTLTGEARLEAEQLRREQTDNQRLLLELGVRRRRVLALSRDPRNVEEAVPSAHRLGEAPDRTERQREALRTIERLHQAGLKDRGAERLDDIVRRDRHGAESSYIAAAGSEAYYRAFGRIVQYGPDAVTLMLSDAEREAVLAVSRAQAERALAVGVGSTGGFAVPVQLDPTVIPTSDGAINPLRNIARVEAVTSNEWRGVTTAGLTAAYAAEAAEASDNSPTLAQPSVFPERAQAFVPFSIEVSQDWGALAEELGRLFRDARDELEAEKFITGTGHTANQPEGLLVGGTAVVATAAATTLAVADLYSLKEALPPRFQPRAVFVGHAVSFDRVRRLTGPGSTEAPVWADEPAAILRRPAHEHSEMPSTLTSGGSVITYGDFSHFLIADRIGMTVEILPHLLGSNRRPTGQRGAYCYWRSTSKVLAWQAFRTLKVT